MKHLAFFLTGDRRARRGPWRWDLAGLIACLLLSAAGAAEFHVAPGGDDANPGTADQPFAGLQRAQDAVRQSAGTGPRTVYLHEGTYYLSQALVLTAEDSGAPGSPVVFAAAPGENVVLSGGVRLSLRWEPFRDGIVRATTPAGLVTDQLFINGQRRHLARYPNFDPSVRHFNGFAPDAFSPVRAARWADPRGGFIHAMHRHEWGDFHYVITGKDEKGGVTYEGGWQNNRRLGMHDKYRFVENIFEELDAPGEWFHDAHTNTLYLYPPTGLDLENATVEAVRLRHLIELRGTRGKPVRFVRFKGLTLRHAGRTFMENREPLLRSDWTTYRGGAVLFDGTEDCSLEDCTLDQVGGNAVFVSNYNRRVTVRGCHIVGAGANGIAFVGDPNAVRNPLFEYGQRQSYRDIDKTPGPKTDNYPADCLVEDCLIHESGRVEKQTAPVQISMSMGITVRHCSIYDVPRAGINISEGTFGGHVIEFCDVFDTVRETGDHGSFNSWGRDRYWGLKDIDLNTITLGDDRRLPLLDIVRPNILRNNRWRCDHGWDIDLDDGSSRYEIYNNLCLNGGLKLREGFYRLVENNIIVSNTFHPHVWYGHSEDIVRRNIVFTGYKPIRVNKPWGKECDHNLLHTPGRSASAPAVGLQQQSGLDANSIEADAMFVDPARGDYRVTEGSPAIALGFKNFAMDRFGVRKPALRALARTPRLPGEATQASKSPQRDSTVVDWLGARIRNVVGLGEVSAAGLPGETGIMILEVPAQSEAARSGLRQGDVILRCGDRQVDTLDEFLRVWRAMPAGRAVTLEVFRDQQRVGVDVIGGPAAPKPLYRDPVHDGAADPAIIWNRGERRWFMFYTNRRANLENPVGVDWVHGTRIGIAESTDGGVTWTYRGTAGINHGREDYSHWAPEVVVSGDRAFLFYFTHPGRRGADEKKNGYEQRRSSIQVVELKQRDDWLICDRDVPTYVRLRPPDRPRTNSEESVRGTALVILNRWAATRLVSAMERWTLLCHPERNEGSGRNRGWAEMTDVTVLYEAEIELWGTVQFYFATFRVLGTRLPSAALFWLGRGLKRGRGGHSMCPGRLLREWADVWQSTTSVREYG